MGRRRAQDINLPPRLHRKGETFYYVTSTLPRTIQPRSEAERQALMQTLARYDFPGAPDVRLLQVEVGDATLWLLSGSEIAAHRALAGLGAGEVVEVDLGDTLRSQFGGLALLAIFP
ncbi:hypothetical protein [Zoogloea sp.]|uniref:hypothetical protein n=1 Tax=Zoogloea sp. TaxID=49181 RepID=UPI0035B20B5F